MISIKNGRKCPKQTVSSKNRNWVSVQSQTVSFQKRTKVSKSDGTARKWTSVYRSKKGRSRQKTNKGVQNQTVPSENGLKCIKSGSTVQNRTLKSKISEYRLQTNKRVQYR